MQWVIFEGDCMVVVKATQNEGECWSTYGQIIEDVKGQLNERGCHIQHAKLKVNQAAHCMEKRQSI